MSWTESLVYILASAFLAEFKNPFWKCQGTSLSWSMEGRGCPIWGSLTGLKLNQLGGAVLLWWVVCCCFSCKLAVAKLHLFGVSQTWTHLSIHKVSVNTPGSWAERKTELYPNLEKLKRARNLGQAPLSSIWLTLQDKSERILGSDSLNMDILFQSVLVLFYAV